MRATPDSQQQALIEFQRVAHLATADANGRPHVVPVCFAYVDGRIYIAIDEKPKRSLRLKRLRNIEANPEVAIVFDRYDEDWTRLGWVLVRGTAAVLGYGPEHARTLAALREKYPQYRAMALEERPVIRITVERVSSWGDLS
ncbi:MAG: TIGR03668 family PPOX class F420-dependent oxidoreductase [Chloroflexi bacterium]|nr:MAG: TIGR03668 family PPOX class F420-dependent oxidoreductase [Chloroflexota bacterium]